MYVYVCVLYVFMCVRVCVRMCARVPNPGPICSGDRSGRYPATCNTTFTSIERVVSADKVCSCLCIQPLFLPLFCAFDEGGRRNVVVLVS